MVSAAWMLQCCPVLPELDNISSLNEEQRMALKAFYASAFKKLFYQVASKHLGFALQR